MEEQRMGLLCPKGDDGEDIQEERTNGRGLI
jgi:hypothetical protein